MRSRAPAKKHSCVSVGLWGTRGLGEHVRRLRRANKVSSARREAAQALEAGPATPALSADLPAVTAARQREDGSRCDTTAPSCPTRRVFYSRSIASSEPWRTEPAGAAAYEALAETPAASSRDRQGGEIPRDRAERGDSRTSSHVRRMERSSALLRRRESVLVELDTVRGTSSFRIIGIANRAPGRRSLAAQRSAPGRGYERAYESRLKLRRPVLDVGHAASRVVCALPADSAVAKSGREYMYTAHALFRANATGSDPSSRARADRLVYRGRELFAPSRTREELRQPGRARKIAPRVHETNVGLSHGNPRPRSPR